MFFDYLYIIFMLLVNSDAQYRRLGTLEREAGKALPDIHSTNEAPRIDPTVSGKKKRFVNQLLVKIHFPKCALTRI